jgi:hypothetical protein
MAKSKKQLKTVDEYIAAFPKEVQDVLEKLGLQSGNQYRKPKRQLAMEYLRLFSTTEV